VWRRIYDVTIGGQVTDGRVFGDDNVRVDGHVNRRINDRRIF
jgi:hypothetical protein